MFLRILNVLFWMTLTFIGIFAIGDSFFGSIYGRSWKVDCNWCLNIMVYGNILLIMLVALLYQEKLNRYIKYGVEKKASITKTYGRLDAWCYECEGFTSHKVDEYKPGYGHLECPLCGWQRMNEELKRVVDRDRDKDKSIRGVKGDD